MCKNVQQILLDVLNSTFLGIRTLFSYTIQCKFYLKSKHFLDPPEKGIRLILIWTYSDYNYQYGDFSAVRTNANGSRLAFLVILIYIYIWVRY